jgi:hypothetical protein
METAVVLKLAVPNPPTTVPAIVAPDVDPDGGGALVTGVVGAVGNASLPFEPPHADAIIADIAMAIVMDGRQTVLISNLRLLLKRQGRCHDSTARRKIRRTCCTC